MKTGSMRCWHLFLGATKHWMKSFSWQEDERTMAGMRVRVGTGKMGGELMQDLKMLCRVI